jgi:glutamyl-tRNA reductase
MNIRMAGVDYTKAGVMERELFTFTAAAREAALNSAHERYKECGFVIIATCNRTELWVCAENGDCPAPDRLLCELKHISFDEYRGLFINRAGKDAVEHLFYLACGLKSRITGENQILSQIKDAVEAARNYALPVLWRLFQSVVSSAKRVKTETGITRADVSIASAALDFIKAKGFDIRGASCLVIGSGVIGRLCAELFEKAGADITMTLRQHKNGKTLLNKNFRVIDYDDRYSLLQNYKIVISATVSPHHTLTYDEVSRCTSFDGSLTGSLGGAVFLDLAMPRDIDPDIKKINGVTLFDIDEINNPAYSGVSRDYRINEQVKKIIDEETASFIEWYEFREYVEIIKAIRNEAAADLTERVSTDIKNCARDKTAEENLRRAVTRSAGKVMDKLLFGLRDNLDEALWKDCFAALFKSSIAGAGRPGIYGAAAYNAGYNTSVIAGDAAEEAKARA